MPPSGERKPVSPRKPLSRLSGLPEQNDEIGTALRVACNALVRYADFVAVLIENPQAAGRATEEAMPLSPLSDDA
jgi:hypothetical protein